MAGKKKERDMLLVQSKVKDVIRGNEMMCSSDLLDQLNENVHWMLERAVERAGSNGRKTARASDI